MIIFEGTDGAGKTTCALRVAAKLAVTHKLTKFSRYGFLPPDWDYLGDYFRDISPFTVVDRFTTSEMVYGNVVRGGPNRAFHSRNRATVARELHRVGALTVYMRPSREVITERIQRRGDESFKLETILKCYDQYDKLLVNDPFILKDFSEVISNFDGTNVLVIDSQDTDRIDEMILEHHHQLHEATQWYRALKTDGQGLTNGRCQALFVGERVNDNREYLGPHFPRAFAVGPAGECLHELIIGAGFDPNLVHIVNARQKDDKPLCREALAWAPALGVPVIALGNTAAKLLEDYDLKFVHCDHPMYIKRFFHAATQRMALWVKDEVAKKSWKR